MGLRRGTQNYGLVLDENGTFIGICLGSDHAAEHEWGIEDLERDFGFIGRSEIGLDRYTIRKCPEELKFHSDEESTTLLYLRGWDLSEGALPQDLTPHRGWDRETKKEKKELDELTTAWGGQSFGIHMRGEYHRQFLSQLYKAFMRKDIAIWQSAGKLPAFDNGGLTIAIASLAPESAQEQMAAAHRKSEKIAKLEEEVESQTNLRKRLKTHGRRYFACNAYLRTDPETYPSNYDLIYWLNPHDQEKNHYGWVTVEDLIGWVQGKGPIPTKERGDRKGVSWHMKP